MQVFEKYFDSYEPTIRRKIGIGSQPNQFFFQYKNDLDYEKRDLDLKQVPQKLLTLDKIE